MRTKSSLRAPDFDLSQAFGSRPRIGSTITKRERFCPSQCGGGSFRYRSEIATFFKSQLRSHSLTELPGLMSVRHFRTINVDSWVSSWRCMQLRLKRVVRGEGPVVSRILVAIRFSTGSTGPRLRPVAPPLVSV